MLLIVGLGNPGPKYERQRHNVGFMAVDEIHRHESFPAWRPKFQALISEGQIAGHKCLLAKPTTFMNESGRAVGEIARFYKIPLSDIVVLYDELDLAPGKVRIKIGGGAGGHNGIRSIDAHLGKDYRRVRIGIGHPGQKDRVSGHVLGDFAKSDAIWRDPLLDEIGRNAEMLVKGDDAGFMNRLALRTQSNEPSGARGQTSAKKKSHIRQANKNGPAANVPKTGPMADMLKKLFGDKDN
ncbi:MAG: aminoacyl-tRNA hydrolase [Rhizobiaceae bacterium]|nr:aminoacyl-tRNA hydrolase [Rhizobiaceae bacterium]